ncbi:hypothetical protein HAX54_048601 [Datura stramonium]|uniref:Uncharacterized protein n=1 Tax=Datura stramonium TaxID=4076 RepID=A0ABS8WMA8_DATST|nr:hypothetical protein [Datura stramonium]
MAITTRSGRVLGPMAETRVNEHGDEATTEPRVLVNEEEIQHKPIMSNKPIVIKVNFDETDKSPAAAREDKCEKQSDPIDKGKRKEKRLAEAEAESGSNQELEEALHKANENKEKRVELHYSEGVLCFLWSSAEAPEGIWPVAHPPLSGECEGSRGGGTPSWAIEGGQIFKSNLNIEEKHWLGFVCSRLTPSKKNNEIPNIQAILISCIMAEDLAIVHNTIEDLEKRFYEIEGISTRDAIASLKADMIKVKNDVQQLQSDLCIFNVSLPDDEVFEDETSETEEEDFEEEHITKETDE